MSYPPNSFNQTLQLAFNRPEVKRVIVELHETYGDRNREFVLEKEWIDTIEYIDGVLEIRLVSKTAFESRIVPWERVREIRFASASLIPPAHL